MSVMLSQFNRVVFLSSFNPNDDIYVSINIPNIDYNILGENIDDSSPNNLFLRTNLDQNLTLDVDDFNFYRDGLVFFILDGNQDIDTLMSHGSAGNGLGVLSPYGTGAANMSGHFSSIAIDLSGGYCLSGEFIGVNTGLTARSPKSITARISSDSLDTEFEYLTTKVLDESELFNFNVENKDIRIRISNNLTLYEVDFRNNVFDNYTNVFKFDTNRDPSKIPLNVKFGIAYSGALRLPIKDVTFSGTLTA